MLSPKGLVQDISEDIQSVFPRLFVALNVSFAGQPWGTSALEMGSPTAGRTSRAVLSMSLIPFVAISPICLPYSSLQDFVSGLSIILRGTIDDRLNWAFNLYDLNKDGCITKEVRWGGPGCSLGLAQVCIQQGQG